LSSYLETSGPVKFFFDFASSYPWLTHPMLSNNWE